MVKPTPSQGVGVGVGVDVGHSSLNSHPHPYPPQEYYEKEQASNDKNTCLKTLFSATTDNQSVNLLFDII
jgi:hypothetical protein